MRRRVLPEPPFRKGNALVPVLGAVVLLATIALITFLWFGVAAPTPQSQEMTSSPRSDDPGTRGSDAAAPPPTTVGQIPDPSERSPLEQQMIETIFDLFQSMQWNQAMDLSVAHRVARAREELAAYLAGLPPEAVPMLLGLLEEEPDFINRRFLIRGLGKIGTAEAIAGLERHYWQMLELNKESEIKYTVEAIGSADNDVCFDALVRLSGDESARPHRWRFIEALGNHSRRTEAVPLFTEALANDPFFRVRSRAALGLKLAAIVDSASRIETALEREKNPYVRQAMIGALGGVRDIQSLGALEEILANDPDLQSRMSAARSIARIGGDRARAILQAVLEREEHQRIHFEAQQGLDFLLEHPQGG
ncbi:MAG TPA: HEAT repeat domain-containing protein [Planctomycetes bacterium]|nr:HEAT repeat domain-containing protein [Planctomycetota bacterium]